MIKVIIVHGLYMGKPVMLPLSSRLSAYGYETVVVNYNSLNIKDSFFTMLDSHVEASKQHVFVGHSLGGLLLKQYLERRQLSVETVSHVVAIGSPLQGCAVMSALEKLHLGFLVGNAKDFGLRPQEAIWALPQKLGSIAGSINMGVRRLLVRDDEASDGTVSVDETEIDGMTDHVVTPNTHMSLIYSKTVVAQINAFIQTGHFEIDC